MQNTPIITLGRYSCSPVTGSTSPYARSRASLCFCSFCKQAVVTSGMHQGGLDVCRGVHKACTPAQSKSKRIILFCIHLHPDNSLINSWPCKIYFLHNHFPAEAFLPAAPLLQLFQFHRTHTRVQPLRSIQPSHLFMLQVQSIHHRAGSHVILGQHASILIHVIHVVRRSVHHFTAGHEVLVGTSRHPLSCAFILRVSGMQTRNF